MILLLWLACIPRLKVADRVGWEPAGETLVFQDVSVFPATGPELLTHQDVLVAGGRIARVAPTGEPAPPAARVIPGAGRTLLPGLIDSHVHLTGEPGPPWGLVKPDPAWNLQAFLYAGVTTVYDLGGDPETLDRLAGQTADGTLAGPRIVHTSSAITAPGSHPRSFVRVLVPRWMRPLVVAGIPTVDGPQDAAAAVERAIDGPGVAFVKITCDRVPHDSPRLDPPTLTALISAAHDHHLPAVVHIGSVEDALDALAGGADVLAHMVYRSALTPDQAAQIAAYRVPMILTSVAFGSIAQLNGGDLTPRPLARELYPRDFLDQATGDLPRRLAERPELTALAQDATSEAAAWDHNIALLHQAGVPLLAGSDAVLPLNWPGESLHEELRRMVAAGIPNAEVLLDATARPAHLWTDTPDFGTIEVGKIADLLLVEGDPLTDITATTQIVTVLRAGRQVARYPEADAP